MCTHADVGADRPASVPRTVTPSQRHPPLELHQFRRAIATNALSALPDEARSAVHDAYRLVALINQFFDRLLHLRVAAGDYQATEKQRNIFRDQLDKSLPVAVHHLREALVVGV